MVDLMLTKRQKQSQRQGEVMVVVQEANAKLMPQKEMMAMARTTGPYKDRGHPLLTLIRPSLCRDQVCLSPWGWLGECLDNRLAIWKLKRGAIKKVTTASLAGSDASAKEFINRAAAPPCCRPQHQERTLFHCWGPCTASKLQGQGGGPRAPPAEQSRSDCCI